VVRVTAGPGYSPVDPRVLTHGQPLRYLGTGPDIMKALAWMAAHTRYEHMGVHPSAFFSPAYEANRHLNVVVRQRGVLHRSIVGTATVADPRSVGYLEAECAAGGEVRVSAAIDRQFILMDTIAALVDVAGAETFRACIIVDPQLVSHWVTQFEHLWQTAAPFGRVLPRLVDFSIRQRQVVRYLSDGATDAEIADRIGVTERTVRTEVAAIRDLLGVRTRFQMGAAYANLLTGEGPTDHLQ
jgi:DNA-binding CsgD family transcriptional regulator